jgi:hypothetical protein
MSQVRGAVERHSTEWSINSRKDRKLIGREGQGTSPNVVNAGDERRGRAEWLRAGQQDSLLSPQSKSSSYPERRDFRNLCIE